MIWDNVYWNDENLLKLYKKTTGIILDYKLAIENYEDFNKVKIEEFHKLEKMWYSRNNTKSSCSELITLAMKVLDGYKAVVNDIGIDNFIIYKDGGIEYHY